MPKKILMTADTIGGVWTYALELTTALAAYGIDVALATMGAPLTPQQQKESEKIKNLEVFESHFKLEWMADPWDDIKQAGEWLIQLEKRLQPDVIHLNGYVHAALPWEAPTVVVGHSCVLSWWQAVKGESAPESWDRYRQEVQRGLQAANLVIAPTKAMLEALNYHYGVIVNSRVIPNGRDPKIFDHSTQKKEFIFCAGRVWDEAKNITMLEFSANQLLWWVYIAGDQYKPLDNQLQATQILKNLGKVERTNIKQLKPQLQTKLEPPKSSNLLQASPVLLGHLSTEELASWYADASIYALPARYEPFGLSVLEAALSRCALVLGDIPSLREVWQDSAVFVPSDDKNALIHAINSLIRDASQRHALATKAYVQALKFTLQRMATGYLSAYQEVIALRKDINTNYRE